MLQLQRWRKRKKNAKKSRKSYVKGKVIDGKHELYTLSIAVMLGVRTSIAKTNTIITSSANNRRMLVPQDFMAEEKYEFAPKVGEYSPCPYYKLVRRLINSFLSRLAIYRVHPPLHRISCHILSSLRTMHLWHLRTFGDCLVLTSLTFCCPYAEMQILLNSFQTLRVDSSFSILATENI